MGLEEQKGDEEVYAKNAYCPHRDDFLQFEVRIALFEYCMLMSTDFFAETKYIQGAMYEDAKISHSPQHTREQGDSCAQNAKYRHEIRVPSTPPFFLVQMGAYPLTGTITREISGQRLLFARVCWFWHLLGWRPC